MAENFPQDTVILTAGSAKFRYNELSLGDISGMPEISTAGQCNDSYSLALIALQLTEVFGLHKLNNVNFCRLFGTNLKKKEQSPCRYLEIS